MFRVEWLRTALNLLATGWQDANAEDRKKITAIVSQIEAELRRNPLQCGESRDGHRRVIVAPPVTIYFEVNERLKLVTILYVRAYRRRRR